MSKKNCDSMECGHYGCWDVNRLKEQLKDKDARIAEQNEILKRMRMIHSPDCNGHQKVLELESKLVRAREGLRRYGTHDDVCMTLHWASGEAFTCDCGFEQALKEIE